MGNPGGWVRKQCLTMAQNGGGPALDWCALPLLEITEWIAANNEIIEERRQREEQNRNRRKARPQRIHRRMT